MRPHDTDIHLPTFLLDAPFKYADDRYVVLDFETTNLEFGTALNPDNRLVCACWYVVDEGNVRKKHIVGGEHDMRALVRDIQSAAFVVAHHAKFELQWLKRCGVDLRKVYPFCTKNAQWVIDGNRKKERSLEALAGEYLGDKKVGLVNKMIREYGVQTEDISVKWLVEYCYKDIELTYRIFLKQAEIIRRDNLEHLVHQRNLTCVCLADIEFNGMCLDPERVKQEYAETLAKQQELKRELDDVCNGINLNSTKQLAKLLYEDLGFAVPTDRWGKPVRTFTGNLPTDADTIESLKCRTKKQSRFVETFKQYRRYTSLLQKNLDFFNRVVKERGGIFQGEFNQGATATGRLSASGRKIEFEDQTVKGAQFTNMPRVYKKLFMARQHGWVVAECDGSQLEFRVGIGMASDEVGLKEIANKEDVHANTALVMTQHGEPVSRQEAKPRSFRPMYGGTSGTPAEVAYIKYFNSKYKQLNAMQESWVNEVMETKRLITPYGLRFYWPFAKYRRDGTADCRTEVFNYGIQGMATGEIIPIALFMLWYRTAGMELMIVNTIHDSIICELPEHEVNAYKELALQVMTFDVYSFLREVYKYDLKVNLGTGIKIAHNWGEGKEIQYDVTPEGNVMITEK